MTILVGKFSRGQPFAARERGNSQPSACLPHFLPPLPLCTKNPFRHQGSGQ